MSTTVSYKGAIITTISNETKSLSTAGTWVEGDIVITDTSGGAVTITDEVNATGTTCVITTGSTPTPTPTPEDIPLNEQLIDYTKCSANKTIDSSGAESELEWYYASDYTPVESGMTFSYTAGYWTRIAVYNSAKVTINVITVANDATVDSNDSNIGHGSLSGSKLPAGSAYVRLSSTGTNSTRMSLIRTA